MTGDAAKVPIARAVGIIAAWVGLAAFNVFALLAFGGWVGAADGFIPWSIAAALLWRFSYRRLGLSPLRATWPGRLILVFWLTLVALAAAGIEILQADANQADAFPAHNLFVGEWLGVGRFAGHVNP